MRPALLLAAAGCATPTADPPTTPAAAPCSDCALTDAHNYTYGAALSADVVPVAAGVDVRVTWEALTVDVHGHPRGDHFEVEDARLIAFLDLSPPEVLDLLAADALTSADISLYATCTPQDDGCALSDFNVFGRTFELETYFTEGSGTWLVVLGSSVEPGGHAYVFLEPRDGAEADRVAVRDDTSAIAVDVDFASRPPLRLRVDDDTALTWADVTRDGLGNPLAVHQIDRMVLGVYPEEGLADLEQAVFDLEALADPLWERDVSGLRSATLGELAAGADLGPLDTARSSLVALYCTACLNPAPRIVAVLDPQPPAP